jgi:hypothetical protein
MLAFASITFPVHILFIDCADQEWGHLLQYHQRSDHKHSQYLATYKQLLITSSSRGVGISMVKPKSLLLHISSSGFRKMNYPIVCESSQVTQSRFFPESYRSSNEL